MNQLQAAGYIVENGDAIWGKGATSDEAWQDFLARMKIADVEVVMERDGDAISWAWRNGVACTDEEEAV